MMFVDHRFSLLTDSVKTHFIAPHLFRQLRRSPAVDPFWYMIHAETRAISPSELEGLLRPHDGLVQSIKIAEEVGVEERAVQVRTQRCRFKTFVEMFLILTSGTAKAPFETRIW